MSAAQIHGFFTGLLSGPGDPEPTAWVEELLRADTGLEVPQKAFRSEEQLKRVLRAIVESYDSVVQSVTGDELTLPFRTESPSADDRYQAARWCEAFWRGFVLADGDSFVRDDDDVRQAMIIPLIIRDPKDALSEVEFDVEPSAADLAEFVTQQLAQLPKVIRLVSSRAQARYIQELEARRRREGNGEESNSDD